MNFDDFLKACKGGDLARVRQGLPDVNPKQTDSDGRTPLMLAALFGHAGVVSVLIPVSDLRHGDKHGETALMWAVSANHVDVVKSLIPGSDLRQINTLGDTALMLAACNGHTDVVRALLSGSDLQQTDRVGFNAYMNAVGAKKWPCVELLALHDPQREQLQWPEAARRKTCHSGARGSNGKQSLAKWGQKGPLPPPRPSSATGFKSFARSRPWILKIF